MKHCNIMTALLLVLVLGLPQPSLGHVCSAACGCAGMGASLSAAAHHGPPLVPMPTAAPSPNHHAKHAAPATPPPDLAPGASLDGPAGHREHPATPPLADHSRADHSLTVHSLADHSAALSPDGVEHDAPPALPAASAPCTMSACAPAFTPAPAQALTAPPLPAASWSLAMRHDDLVVSLHTAALFRPPRA